MVESIPEFDRHEIRTQFLSLFNQRINPMNGQGNWTGDWLYRRERLTIIDQELSEFRPTLIIFQELLERIGNPYESDKAIISANSLKGFQWSVSPVETYNDSGEVEALAVAANLPIELDKDEAKLWRIGSHAVALKKLHLEKQDLYVINLKMTSPILSADLDEIADSINLRLTDGKACRKRILIGAYIPSDAPEKIEKFLSKLDLKDVSKDFCNIENDCFTTTSRNESFFITNGEQQASRTDFIFVSKLTQISISKRNMNQPKQPETAYYKNFDLSASWPSNRFGWFANLRFAKCSNNLP